MSRLSRQPAARAAVARLPPRPRAVQLVPSTRSVVVSLALAALALVAYIAARDTSMFAVRSIEVLGVRAEVARRVEHALKPLRGESLLKVQGDEVAGLATALPFIAGVTYDRAFPHTLRVRVQAEEPVAVVRQGFYAWLVSRHGRIMDRIKQRTRRTLPRIWLDKSVGVSVGATVAAGGGAEQVQLLDALRGARLARRVASVHETNGQWIYVLRGGLELRVGTRSDLALKLAVAARILRQTRLSGYLDVSVPQRPVALGNVQVSG